MGTFGNTFSLMGEYSVANNFTTEYKAILAKVVTKPSLSIQIAQNAFVKSLVNGGVWAKFTHIIPYAWGMPNASDALLWINSPTNKAVLSSTPPTYVVGQGFTGNGTSSYINTKFNPLRDGGSKFTQNDASYGWYYSNQKTVTTAMDSGVLSTNGVIMSPNNGSATCYYALNSTSDNSPLVGSNYLLILSRTASSGYNFYVNKITPVSKTKASAALKNLEMYSLSYNNGTTATDLGTDTIGLEFGGSSLTQNDINLINDAWANLLSNVRLNILFGDTCDGTVIDINKWTVLNPDLSKILINQNNSINVNSLPAGGVGDYFANMISSNVSSIHGVFSFSVSYTKKNGYYIFGLSCGANKIEFITDTVSGNIDYKIIYNGGTVYTATNVCANFGEFKIVVDQYHNISAYLWTNNAWTQIGITYNQPMGEKKIFMASRGYYGSILSMRDAYITLKDRTTLLPIVETNMATDSTTLGIVSDGVTDVSGAINTALQSGNVLLQHGRFLVNSSILIPSNRTLYIKNALIKLADNSFDNVFRNSDPLNGNNNVRVLGLGNAVIDGNATGNNSVNYSIFGGTVMTANNLYKANTFFIGNVDTFEISGLNIIDHPAYVATLQKATNGSVHDLFVAYQSVTQNQDGIQICHGSHNINIYNITGNTGDDFVSIFISSIFPSLWYNYGINSHHEDVHDIVFNNLNIYGSVYHGVIFITGDGDKIYNIQYDNVHVYSCFYLSYFGIHSYYTTPPTKDDVYNITMNNITVDAASDSSGAVIRAYESCKDITITNFVNNTGKTTFYKDPAKTVENFSINGVIQ